VLAVTIMASTISYIDESVVNIALPTIEADLKTSAAVVQWLVNAYMLSLTALVLVGGAAGDQLQGGGVAAGRARHHGVPVRVHAAVVGRIRPGGICGSRCACRAVPMDRFGRSQDRLGAASAGSVADAGVPHSWDRTPRWVTR